MFSPPPAAVSTPGAPRRKGGDMLARMTVFIDKHSFGSICLSNTKHCNRLPIERPGVPLGSAKVTGRGREGLLAQILNPQETSNVRGGRSMGIRSLHESTDRYRECRILNAGDDLR